MTISSRSRRRQSGSGAQSSTAGPSKPHNSKQTNKKPKRANSPAAIQWADEGALRGIARRNQLLPWSWDHLTPLDLSEIADLLWDLPPRSSARKKEAAFAIAAILTTGRRLSHLLTLVAFDTEVEMRSAGASEGLIRNNGKPYWRMVAGSPGRQAARRPDKSGRKRYPTNAPAFIPFILAPVAHHCLKRIPASKTSSSGPLFAYDFDRLKPTIEDMLYERRHDTRPPRRSSRTLEAIERYLATAISHQSGGDIGPAARFTDSDEVMSRSVIHYGVSDLSSTLRRAREATAILNRGEPSYRVKGVKAPQIGSPRNPTWPDVKRLIQRCGDFLASRQSDVEVHHDAFTFYTMALLGYSTGHRGITEPLPGQRAVDPVTLFCTIHEKARHDPVEARLLWVPPVAEKQIAAYEAHLRGLASHLNPTDFAAIDKQTRSGRLPLFTISNGHAVAMTFRATWKKLNADVPGLAGHFHFHENSGRHWLRSELEGQCSTETLHAFFGHWQIGTEPWSLGSCFDPLLYRADLEARLEGVLRRVGWVARDATGAAL